MTYNEACKIFDLKSKFYTHDNIKSVYRKLCKKHHPDKGGDVAIMQQVNVAYDVLLQHLKSGNHYVNNYDYADFQKAYDDYWKGFRKQAYEDYTEHKPRPTFDEIVKEILTWDTENLHVSILKSKSSQGNPRQWIMVTGNTYPHKEKLKEMWFNWDPEMKVWKNY